MAERTDDVLLIKPTDAGDVSYVEDLKSEEDVEGIPTLLPVGEENGETFHLECDLQTALRANIEQLQSGLSIIDGGQEQTTEAGRVDITAEDLSGALVVIELKAGTASANAVAQILAYMGVLSESSGRRVTGVLVAGDFHPRVQQAAKAVANLRLVKYSYQFRFQPVD